MKHTKKSLVDFEKRVEDAFLAKQIRAPIHLSGGNEEQLLEIFEDVEERDWLFTTWRSHYHCLLKGMPEEKLFEEILAGRSMSIISKEHRIYSSAIVGGILPIAAGVAEGIKRNGGSEKVWVFVGDMTATTGIFHEFMQWTEGRKLPVKVVVEDNNRSTDTDTRKSWGYIQHLPGCPEEIVHRYYQYERKHPHVGAGQFVTF
jgi:pyruvate dehydrogenase E1 component alpha subunit